MSPKILLVEDNVVNQKVIQAFLEKKGYAVEIVSSGFQALSAVHRAEYSLIFMDLRIPNLDGFAAARAIRQTGCTIPIIAVTAGAMDDDEKRCLEAGMNGYITKPFVNADFDHVLKRWLNIAENDVAVSDDVNERAQVEERDRVDRRDKTATS